MKISLRPYLGVNQLTIEYKPIEVEDGAMRLDIAYRFLIENFGNTPAQATVALVQVEAPESWEPSSFASDFLADEKPPRNSSFANSRNIAKGASETKHGTFEYLLAPKAAEFFRTGLGGGIRIGIRLRYRDVFQGEHEEPLCWIYSPRKGLADCDRPFGFSEAESQ